jgi:hypothetical protein
MRTMPGRAPSATLAVRTRHCASPPLPLVPMTNRLLTRPSTSGAHDAWSSSSAGRGMVVMTSPQSGGHCALSAWRCATHALDLASNGSGRRCDATATATGGGRPVGTGSSDACTVVVTPPPHGTTWMTTKYSQLLSLLSPAVSRADRRFMASATLGDTQAHSWCSVNGSLLRPASAPWAACAFSEFASRCRWSLGGGEREGVSLVVLGLARRRVRHASHLQNVTALRLHVRADVYTPTGSVLSSAAAVLGAGPSARRPSMTTTDASATPLRGG